MLDVNVRVLWNIRNTYFARQFSEKRRIARRDVARRDRLSLHEPAASGAGRGDVGSLSCLGFGRHGDDAAVDMVFLLRRELLGQR